jgi:hypothetical protein
VTTANADLNFRFDAIALRGGEERAVERSSVECQMFERGRERKIAYFVRKWLGVDNNSWIDVIEYLSLGRIWTVRGEKRLVLEIVSSSKIASSEMHGVDAITINGKDVIIIKVTESVYKLALARVARARMTLAHELGHAVLCHPGDALARITGVSRSTPISPVARRFESEANRFAFYFLVKDELAQFCASPQSLSDRFGSARCRLIFGLRRGAKTKRAPGGSASLTTYCRS